MAKKGFKLTGQEVMELEKTFLPNITLVPLANIATIKRAPQWMPDTTTGGTSFQVITNNDLPVAGFIKSASRQISLANTTSSLSFFKLQAYDLLITLHEQTIRMGIVNKGFDQNLIPDKDIIVVRFKETLQENVFSLYVFLKTELGKKILAKIITKAKKHLPLLSVTLFSYFLVPALNEIIIKEAMKAIEVEAKFHGKIADIQMVIAGIFVDYLNKIQEKI